MTTYAVGFYFNRDMSEVVLIRKKKPKWQEGKLNGVGGKVEAGETFIQAMVREFKEETGLQTRETEWSLAIEQRGEDYVLAVFHGISSTLELPFIETQEEEQVSWFRVQSLPERSDLIHNIPWYVFLAFDQQVIRPLQVRT